MTPEETQSYFDWLATEDGGHCKEIKDIGEGLFAAIKPLLYHWTLIVGQIGDKFCYIDRWCYANETNATTAIREWNGLYEPKGWHRHPSTGRRRPDGDPKLEYKAA